MKFGLPDRAIRGIRAVLGHYPMVERAVLYGSRAKGTHKDGSDVDIALFGGTELTLSVTYRILNELDELYLPYTVDLAVFRYISDPDVIGHIQRVGIELYARGEEAAVTPGSGA